MSYQPPPPPPPPPGGPGPPPGGYGGQPGPDFNPHSYSPLDALSYGWKRFTENLGPFLGITVLLVVVGLGLSLVSGALLETGPTVMQTDPFTGMTTEVHQPGLGASVASGVISLVSGVVQFILATALIRAAIDVVDTGRADIGTMFTRIPWLHMILAGILVGLVSLVGIILCIIPGIIAAFLLSFTNFAVVDGSSATDAMGASFRFTKAHVGPVLLLLLIFIGLGILSVCTLGLGFLVLVPVGYIATAYTWGARRGRRPVGA